MILLKLLLGIFDSKYYQLAEQNKLVHIEINEFKHPNSVVSPYYSIFMFYLIPNTIRLSKLLCHSSKIDIWSLSTHISLK